MSSRNPEPYRYRYEVFETPETDIPTRLMPIVLGYWGRTLRVHPLAELIPSEGLNLRMVPARLNLTIEQHGDMTLNINDVLGAIDAMSTHYEALKDRKSVALGEVHIIQGFYLQGLMKVIPNSRNGGGPRVELGNVASELLSEHCPDHLTLTGISTT